MVKKICRNTTIVGRSHTTALSNANKSYKRKSINIVNIGELEKTNTFDQYGYDKEVFLKEKYGSSNLLSMVGGTYYNTFGLIEHPVRFDFLVPDSGQTNINSDRQLILYDQIYTHFKIVLQTGMLKGLKSLRAIFIGHCFHVCPPPPIADEKHLRKNPGEFKFKMHLGIAPRHLRMKLYNLHILLVREFCVEHDITFIEPPVNSEDDEGVSV